MLEIRVDFLLRCTAAATAAAAPRHRIRPALRRGGQDRLVPAVGGATQRLSYAQVQHMRAHAHAQTRPSAQPDRSSIQPDAAVSRSRPE